MGRIEVVDSGVYRFPTEQPEADGTLAWDATVAVTVQVAAGGCTGLGWTYSTGAAAGVIREHLAAVVADVDAMDVPGAWQGMRRACRNLGTAGLVMQAISAVDIALWDLKARLLDMPLAALFGRCRETVPVYGSGGFTNLRDDQLAEQVETWRAAGCRDMKIKIGESWGRNPRRDLQRVRRLAELAGDGVALMVDANGGYDVAQATRIGADLDEFGVVWFEEPVSSEDTRGLHAVAAALRCAVAAGEYSADASDTARLCGAVDCIQLDVTRCGGYTGWLRAAAVAQSHHRDVSAHCAPSLHAPVAAAIPNFLPVEWFIDHARLEPELVDGVPEVRGGELQPTRGPGHGLTLAATAEQYRQH